MLTDGLVIGRPRTKCDAPLRIASLVFQNVPALIAAIRDYIDDHNPNPQVFVWAAPVEQILAKVAKSEEVLDALH